MLLHPDNGGEGPGQFWEQDASEQKFFGKTNKAETKYKKDQFRGKGIYKGTIAHCHDEQQIGGRNEKTFFILWGQAFLKLEPDEQKVQYYEKG